MQEKVGTAGYQVAKRTARQHAGGPATTQSRGDLGFDLPLRACRRGADLGGRTVGRGQQPGIVACEQHARHRVDLANRGTKVGGGTAQPRQPLSRLPQPRYGGLSIQRRRIVAAESHNGVEAVDQPRQGGDLECLQGFARRQDGSSAPNAMAKPRRLRRITSILTGLGGAGRPGTATHPSGGSLNRPSRISMF